MVVEGYTNDPLVGNTVFRSPEEEGFAIDLNILFDVGKSDIKSDQSVIELYNKIKNNYGDVNAIVYSAGITSKKKST